MVVNREGYWTAEASRPEETERRLRIERGFYRIAAVLGASLSLRETLSAVAQAAAEALGGSSAAMLMPDGGGLRLVASQGLPKRLGDVLADKLPDAAGVLAACARDRNILAAPALEGDERFEPEWRDLALEGGCRALLAIPLEHPRHESAGLVIVFFEAERGFTDDDLDLARHFAGAARGALERSELFETERRSSALAQQLARTSRALATALDPEAILAAAVRDAPRLLEADAATVQLLDGDELVVRAAIGRDGEAAVGARSPSTAGPPGDVVHSGRPVAIDDVGERLLALGPFGEGYETYLGVPMGGDATPTGVLSIFCAARRAWRPEEVEALRALAANASAALASAELYRDVALTKERNDAILANIADGIVATDRDDAIVLWNAAAEQITGVPPGEALGHTPAQVLGRSLSSDGDDALGNRVVPIERGGEDVWLSLTEAVIHDASGAVTGRVFAFRDISAEHQVEQLKSDFVTTVSHELRTPLTSIYGFAATLLRNDVLFDEDERRTFLGYITTESERLTSIVDSLLNVARLEAGDLELEITSTDVGAVVNDVVASARNSAAASGHRFVVELPEPAPAAQADAGRLRQILHDLVDNAIKFSPECGDVTVSVREHDGRVEFRVADEGVGIPQSEQGRLFAKFYRNPAAPARDGGGPALSLFLVRGLVRAMGGRIWVSSIEGRGSTFAFELPSAPVSEERE